MSIIDFGKKNWKNIGIGALGSVLLAMSVKGALAHDTDDEDIEDDENYDLYPEDEAPEEPAEDTEPEG